jgi:hypothetical protein
MAIHLNRRIVIESDVLRTTNSTGGEASRSLIEEVEASRLEPQFLDRGNQELSRKKQAIRNAQMSRLANAVDDTTAMLGLDSEFEIIA